MAKKKLMVEFDYDFFLVGIACPEKVYRVCWALNEKLRTNLCKSSDLEVPDMTLSRAEQRKNTFLNFPVFTYHHEELFSDFRVIQNRKENKYLIPEYRQADYLLMVQGGFPYADRVEMIRKIKEVSFFQTAFEINPKSLKSKDNLLF